MTLLVLFYPVVNYVTDGKARKPERPSGQATAEARPAEEIRPAEGSGPVKDVVVPPTLPTRKIIPPDGPKSEKKENNEIRSIPESEITLTRFPVAGGSTDDIISGFGDPRSSTRYHEGVDIQAERGRPVLAGFDGRVLLVRDEGAGGKQIWLVQDDTDIGLYYAHLHRMYVRGGEEVSAGEVLGTVGNTGNAVKASPHLHFAIYRNRREAFNPLPILERIAARP